MPPAARLAGSLNEVRGWIARISGPFAWLLLELNESANPVHNGVNGPERLDKTGHCRMLSPERDDGFAWQRTLRMGGTHLSVFKSRCAGAVLAVATLVFTLCVAACPPPAAADTSDKAVPDGAPKWADQFTKDLAIGSPAKPEFSENSIAAINRATSASLVHIISFDAKGTPIGNGTGVFVGDGLVATNLHIIRGAVTWSIASKGGKALIAPVTIKKQSRAWNLAILTTEKKATALPIGETNDLETGDAVLVVSSAQDGSPAGKINRVGGKRTDGGTLRYSLDEQIAPGASGAPVFDTDGRLTGIATFLLRGSRFDSLVTPVSALKALLPSIRPVKARVAATTRRGSSEKDLKNDVTLAKYEKTLHSSKEILTLQNKTKRNIGNIKFLLTYKDLKGRTIRSRQLTLEGTIPAQKERTGTYKTPEKLRPYEYIHGEIVLGDNLYDIEIVPLEYDIIEN